MNTYNYNLNHLRESLAGFSFFFFSAVLSFVSTAQQVPADSTEYSSSTIVLPAISSSPETSLLFGGLGIYQFQVGDPQLETRPSVLLISGVYTLKNQISLNLAPSLFLAGESWLLSGMYSYNYFPESFWGVGAFTSDENEMKMIYRQIYLDQSVLRKVYPNLFVGPQLRWANTFNIRFEDPDGHDTTQPKLQGAEDYSTFGLGIGIHWDTRKNTITPTGNHAISFLAMTNPSWLSTIDTYTTYMIDARKYYDLSLKKTGESVLAFQALTKLTSGNPPFKDIAMLGGESVLRGYYAGRLRDRHGAQLQTEFRQHLTGRLGFAIFAAAGQVWPSFDEMNLDRTRISGGGGFRFNLNKKDPTNIRMDWGFGQNTSGFYLTIGEAF